MAARDEALVIIPTFNEAENLPTIAARLLDANPSVHLLVADDNSPDGTGEIADRLAADDERIHVLHRENKEGLLAAYLAGFAWGEEHGFGVLCQMDADGSHRPEQLPALLEAIDDGADLAIGSRYVPGGRTVDWPAKRRLLSKAGNLYISVALGLGVRDATAGFRAYRPEVLRECEAETLSNKGYIFQVELTFRAAQAGFRIDEVPITFADRELGESKLSGSFVADSLIEVTRWAIRHRFNQIAAPLRAIAGSRRGR
ncbi:polyprenol monophosphomannose synthase [Corynebacterium otitidis]|uniref:polyprenol monophosphomannose synthase n=1 Tax=Corynebacterium otitidis TaxID=29321 RepID=UPI0006282A12|nr:polyprenol monophosphomannose synthase [Corynebacterium otitidis]KKO84604.1 polyprenol monophosphomannose synthase [Corynebacterium otitidis]